ncbi:hypothetical protein UFOVP299_28 [uncultured Caudovirales phage]|uniref:Uncharacterized protein n=1 Tax=uncultured Caudovirales phage TaxID=2100421 RepID=A0A6J5LSN9_9CAUD|nr:hypothetical protein UFOVP299_28 [uncultured Caudovirales phage]
MTLKEKFEEILIAFWTSDWEGQCEQVADEFAIGFAEWLFNIDKEALKKQLNHFKEEKGL